MPLGQYELNVVVIALEKYRGFRKRVCHASMMRYRNETTLQEIFLKRDGCCRYEKYPTKEMPK